VRLQNFLRRNGYPHHLLSPGRRSRRAGPRRAVRRRFARRRGGLSERHGAAQSERRRGRALPRHGRLDEHDELHDVAIVGAGPAGLATAVYAAVGRAARHRHRLQGLWRPGRRERADRELPGFPTGISGEALAGRAFVQAQKFGAEMLIPAKVVGLDCSSEVPSGEIVLTLADRRRIRCRTAVVATGARYRRPELAELRDYEGRGVWYWASPIEAKICAQQEVVLVGGGNSAGQAAVYLSAHARRSRCWSAAKASPRRCRAT
jgi:thioredoxin reductase (NADPH)